LDRGGYVAALRTVGVVVVGLANEVGAPGAVIDVDGTYRRWFSEHGWIAVAVRPDFYVYGTAVDTHSALALVDELINALTVSTPERLAEVD
jgi:hypothetical protein